MRKKIILHALSVFFWLAIWYIAVTIANKGLMVKIPGPFETLQAFCISCSNPKFWKIVFSSIGHIFAGYLTAVIVGTILGIVSGLSQGFRIFTGPVMHLVKTVPVAALIIVLWLWIPSKNLPAIISFLLVMPIIFSHAVAGVGAVDEKLVEVGRIYGFSPRMLTTNIRLPLILPHIRTGCLTGIGIAWKSGIAAEIIASPTGTLGSELSHAKTSLEYQDVFAITLMIILLAALFEGLLKLIWKEHATLPKKLLLRQQIPHSGTTTNNKLSKEVLVMDKVSFGYDGRDVIKDFSLALTPSRRVAFRGSSGIGKTTLIRLISGLLTPATGSIYRAGSQSIVFQEDRLMPFLTVEENMRFVAGSIDTEDIDRILSGLNILEYKNSYPASLSGGTSRRAAIARALAVNNADIYMFDEPFTGLDDDNLQKSADLINELTASDKIVILVSHDREDIDRLGIEEVFSI